MSHDLEIKSDGTAAMFYAGNNPPWHGLGKKVENALTAEEAIIEAGLNWSVIEKPIYLNQVNTQIPIIEESNDDMLLVSRIEMPGAVKGWKALVRNDNNLVLNIAHSTYKPVQNKDAFKFFDDVTTVGAAKYHTAGSLNNGRRIWLLAKLPGELVIAREDVVEKYVLLANSHDGSLALTMQWTPIRVVCQNTLRVALNKGQSNEKFYAKHTMNIGNKVDRAREILGIANRFYTEFAEQAQRLAQFALPAPDISRLIMNITGLDMSIPANADEQHETKKETYNRIMELVEVGRGQTATIKGTGWGVYNAVTEYCDHYMTSKSDVDGARLNKVWFGAGAAIKEEAWDRIKALRAGVTE